MSIKVTHFYDGIITMLRIRELSVEEADNLIWKGNPEGYLQSLLDNPEEITIRDFSTVASALEFEIPSWERKSIEDVKPPKNSSIRERLGRLVSR